MKTIVGGALALGLLAAALAQAQTQNQGMGDPTAPINNGGPPPGPRRPAVIARGPSLKLAIRAAEAAVKSCTGQPVGVAILDQTGFPKLYYIPDNVAGFHAYTGFRKANAALLIKAPSEDLPARMAADPELAAKVKASNAYMTFAGGLPIVVKGEVIGAIGVSGAEPSAKDEACAADGVKAIQGELK
jgi:uncharacterized protein GlcG (DUF336 family)